MKSYCVIEFEDKDEKKQVLTLLMDTEAEYKVTADLKKFVAEKFSVTIMENVVVSPNDIDPVDIKRENIGNTVDVAPTTVDTLQPAQQTPITTASNTIVAQPPVSVDISQNSIETKVETGDRFADVSPTINAIQERQNVFSIPDPTVADQPIPEIDNTQNLMNMDDYATYVPYLERPIEPKKENVDDTAAVVDKDNNKNITDMHELLEDEEEMEIIIGDGNDDGLIGSVAVDNLPADVALIPNQANSPSSSITRRSGRSAKKPRYLIADDSDDEEYTPPTKAFKNSDQTLKKVAGGKNKKTACKKCGTEVVNEYATKMQHVITHTDIMRFKCAVNGCEMKCKTKGNMSSHMQFKHKSQLNAFTNIELTSEQKVEIDSKMKECFDDSDGNSDDSCQICHQSIGGKSSNSSSMKKEHALHHVDFMLYTCTENGCSFESKNIRTMKRHVHCAHPKIANPTLTKIKLTAEQELEVEDIVVKCFPILGKDRSVA